MDTLLIFTQMDMAQRFEIMSIFTQTSMKIEFVQIIRL
jgi:hypothetical protein